MCRERVRGVVVDEELEEEVANAVPLLRRQGGPLAQDGPADGGDALELRRGHLAVLCRESFFF